MIAAGPLLILLALLGAPLFAVIAASAMLGFMREGIDLQAVAIEFYGIAEMPIATSSYWNNVIAGPVGDAAKDDEGMGIMKTLGTNIAKLLNS